jgi:Putative Actinobacterial Holin-X, holin superfamily III
MVQTESAHSPDGAAEQSLGDLVSLAVKDLSKLVKWEIDLAKLELKADVKRLGLAGALLAVGAFTGCLVLVLLCFALAYGLQTLGIWSWASFLIVAGVGVLVIGAAAGIALLKMRKLSGLKRTRKTVQEDLALMHRDEEPATVPAVEAR